jgi:hypothetical protein
MTRQTPAPPRPDPADADARSVPVDPDNGDEPAADPDAPKQEKRSELDDPNHPLHHLRDA